jgi:hypothetical protein
MSFEDWDLLELDRELRRAAKAWVGWRRRLRAGSGLDEDPFAAFPFVSRLGFEHLSGRSASDPLRDPARRWLYRLVDEKACGGQRVASERQRRHARFRLDEPERVELSHAELVKRALSDRVRTADWWAAALDRSHEVGERERELWERRADVASRLRLSSADELSLPHPEIYAVAEGWLETTADAAAEFSRDSFGQSVSLGLGLDAGDGWPARLTPRSLGGLFGETALLSSYRLDLGPLPAALAPASVLRALARLGVALTDAAAPTRQPFVIAHDPFGLRRSTMGALFAMVPRARPFLKRVLGIGSTRLREHERALARVTLLASRAAALRVVLRRPALQSARDFREQLEARTARSFGAPLPGHAAGAILRLRADDPQRFAGWLAAATFDARFVEEHDEDWYRNPRATDEVRAVLALPPETTTVREALDEGASTLRRSLYASLG